LSYSVKDEAMTDKIKRGGNMKAGDVIKLSKGQIKAIKAINERGNIARQMAMTASKAEMQANIDLWEAIFQMMPEAIGYSCTLKNEKEIVVEREYSEYEKQRRIETIAERKKEED